MDAADTGLLNLQPMTIFLGLAAIFVVWLIGRPKKNLPPGPPRLPLIGTMLSFNFADYTHPHKLNSIIDKYGEIFTLAFMGKYVIYLNSYEVIKEAMLDKPLEFIDRNIAHGYSFSRIHQGITARDYNDGAKGIRTKSLNIFRDLGVGRKVMEELITQEAKELCDSFGSHDGQAFDPGYVTTAAVCNVILQTTASKRYDYNDAELLQLIDNLDLYPQSVHICLLLDKAPFLRVIPKVRQLFSDVIKSSSGVTRFMWKHAKEAVSNSPRGERSNFTEAFIADADERERAMFGELLRDFALAGTETTAGSLKWSLLELANNPDIQEKLHAAIHDVIHDRNYRLSDNIPYLDAFVWEIQRLGSVVPVGVVHSVSAAGDGQLGGYTIPKKDTFFYCNIYAVHRNKKTWGDPEVFRPERFINAKGEYVKHPHVIPFGIGKRSCLAELLARQELYIFTAMVSQRFKILREEGVEQIGKKPSVGFARTPRPFKIRVVPR